MRKQITITQKDIELLNTEFDKMTAEQYDRYNHLIQKQSAGYALILDK
jgi:hypothetical protein